jgi:hypothetical protein
MNKFTLYGFWVDYRNRLVIVVVVLYSSSAFEDSGSSGTFTRRTQALVFHHRFWKITAFGIAGCWQHEVIDSLLPWQWFDGRRHEASMVLSFGDCFFCYINCSSMGIALYVVVRPVDECAFGDHPYWDILVSLSV